MNYRTPSCSKVGFTLVELLVVIGIIALLISILLPSLGKARKSAQATACLSNLRQIHVAFVQYTTDNRGNFLRRPGASDGYINWMYVIYPYLDRANFRVVDPNPPFGKERTPKVMICPRTDMEQVQNDWQYYGGTFKDTWSMGANRPWNGSYGLNEWFYTTNYTNYSPNNVGDPTWGYMKALSVRNATEVPVFGDCVWYTANPNAWDGVPASPYISTNWTKVGDYCTVRHGKTTNLVFADGHAAAVQLPELWTLPWNKQWYNQTPAVLPDSFNNAQ